MRNTQYVPKERDCSLSGSKKSCYRCERNTIHIIDFPVKSHDVYFMFAWDFGFLKRTLSKRRPTILNELCNFAQYAILAIYQILIPFSKVKFIHNMTNMYCKQSSLINYMCSFACYREQH